MIQRVQTALLMAVVILFSSLFFVPLATFQAEGQEYVLMADSLRNVVPGGMEDMVVWSLFAMLCIMVLLPFVTIFFYKKRMLQVRMAIFSAVIDALFYLLYFYECSIITKNVGVEVSYKVMPLVVPVIAIVLTIIAIRNIIKDEMMIRALNSSRLR